MILIAVLTSLGLSSMVYARSELGTNPRRAPQVKPRVSELPQAASNTFQNDCLAANLPSQRLLSADAQARLQACSQATMKLGPVSGGHDAQGSKTELANWDGCDEGSQIQGGFGGSGALTANAIPEQSGGKDQGKNGCGGAMINPALAEHMKKFLLPCLQGAAQIANLPKVEKVFVRHMGVYNNRTIAGSSKASQHAFGRAIDVAAFEMMDASGKPIGTIDANVKAYKGQNQSMYDSFLKCWGDSVKNTPPPCGGEGETGGLGHSACSPPHKDPGGKHDDHYHLSFATCKGGGSNAVARHSSGIPGARFFSLGLKFIVQRIERVFALGINKAWAQTPHSRAARQRPLRFERFALADNRGHVQLRITDDGESLGHEIFLALKAECKGDKRAFGKLPLVEAFATCKVDLNSIKFDFQNEALTFSHYPPDAKDYNKQTRVDALKARMKCATAAVNYIISTSKVCR